MITSNTIHVNLKTLACTVAISHMITLTHIHVHCTYMYMYTMYVVHLHVTLYLFCKYRKCELIQCNLNKGLLGTDCPMFYKSFV